MSKKVFILGIGGSGSRVASLMANRNINNVSRIISLTMDTDLKDLNEINNTFNIPLTNLETVSDVITRIGEDKLTSWFPIGKEYNTQFFKTIDMHKGTHLWRMQSLLAFTDYILNEEKYLEFTSYIDQMFEEGYDVKNLEFYVLASICGGTGSGLFLPVSFFIKKYIKEKYKENIKINLVLLCPDIYSDSITGELKTKCYANSYAALQELHNVIEVTNGYNQKAIKNYQTIIDYKLYLGNDILFNSLDPKANDKKILPFSNILLFDKIPSVSGILSHENVLSSIITMKLSRDNEEEKHNKNMFTSILMTKVNYPYQSNIEYILLRKTYDDIVKQWLYFYDYVHKQKELRKYDNLEFGKTSNSQALEADKLIDTLDLLTNNENYDEFVLNRVQENENTLIQYFQGNEKFIVDELRKELIESIFNKHKYLDDLGYNEQIMDEIFEEKIGLFDSQDSKKNKKTRFVNSVKKVNDKINEYYKALLIDFYKFNDKYIKEELSLLVSKMIKNDSNEFVHPMIALTRILKLYKQLSIHKSKFMMISEDKVNSDDFKVVIPDHLYDIKQIVKEKFNKYLLSGDERFFTVLSGDLKSIRNFVVDFSHIKFDALKIMDNVKEYIDYYYLESTCNYLNDLIVNYNNLFKSLKTYSYDYEDKIKEVKREGTISNIVYMNVGASVEEKELAYNTFCRTEDNFKYEDSLVGKLFYDYVIDSLDNNTVTNDINTAKDIFDWKYKYHKETLEDNNVIQKIKNINIIELLESNNIFDDSVDVKNISNKLRRVSGGISLPLSIKNILKNNEDSPEITEKMMINEKLMNYIINNKNKFNILSDNKDDILNQFLFKIGSTNHFFEVNNNVTDKEILVTNEITKMPLYWFNKADELDIDNLYYKYFCKIIYGKKISMSELWNPYIYKSKGNQNLLYLNPQMQVLSEEKLGKAFLWMLISNKLFLDLEDKEAKKSRYVFYSVFNGLDKPILFDEEVIKESEIGKIFAYINNEVDILNQWAKELDKYVESDFKETTANLESPRYLEIVENHIFKSSLVNMLTSNIYNYIRTPKKVKAKTLIEYLYDATMENCSYNSIVITVIAKIIKEQILNYLSGTQYDYKVVYKNIVTELINSLNNYITDIDKLSEIAKWVKKLFS